MKESSAEYFSEKNVPFYDYDQKDFLKYCEIKHPNAERLIKNIVIHMKSKVNIH